jgi:hypothetical protein
MVGITAPITVTKMNVRTVFSGGPYLYFIIGNIYRIGIHFISVCKDSAFINGAERSA